jgi:ankyrin repeat protein
MPDTTALLQAFRENNFQEAKLLLENDKNLTSDLNEYYHTQILDKVISQKAFELIPILIEQKLIGTDVYEYDSFKKSVFASIIPNLKEDEESIQFLDELLSQMENLKDEVADQTLLSYAFEEGAELWLIKKIVDAGLDVNYRNNANAGLLHATIRNNSIKPEKAVDYVTFLIENGLDVNATDVLGQTPLIYAIEYNKPQYLELLLQNGADPNHQDASGESAFFKTIVHKNDLKQYLILREYDRPQFDQVNKEGVTMLFDFMRRIYRSDRDTVAFLVQLLEDGADLLQPAMWYGKEKTPLEVAAEKQFEFLEAILNLDLVEINATDKDGNTLLHKVCAFNVNYDKEAAKDTYRKVKLLIEKGADASISNSKEETAMMLASDDNLKTKTVEILLAHQKS